MRTGSIVFVLGCALVGCGRIGFDPGLGGMLPAGSIVAAPNVGGRSREIKLRLSLEAGAARFELRRAPGMSAPDDCGSGTLVTAEDVDAPAEHTRIDRVDDPWYRRHGYRLCVTNVAGELATAVAEGVRYFDPGPGCLRPPCTVIDSTLPVVQFVRGPTVTSTGVPASEGGGDFLLADLDDDRDLDAVIARIGTDVWHINDGTGAFGVATPFETTGTETQAAVVGDFTNDNVIDVIAMHRDVPPQIYIGTGSGTFALPQNIGTNTYGDVFDVDAADLDNDTHLDLVIGRYGGETLLFRGLGLGTFAAPISLLPGRSTTTCVNCVRLADIDGDDIVDILLGYNMEPEQVAILRGHGNATYELPLAVFGSFTTVAIAPPIDLDHDGDLDLVASQSSGGGTYVSLASSATGFANFTQIQPGSGNRTYGIAAADIDGDGHVDVVSSDEGLGPVSLLRGIGNGSFAPTTLVDPAQWATANIELGDVDGDGRLDLAVGMRDVPSQVFLAR